jgi:hypothetical protein
MMTNCFCGQTGERPNRVFAEVLQNHFVNYLECRLATVSRQTSETGYQGCHIPPLRFAPAGMTNAALSSAAYRKFGVSRTFFVRDVGAKLRWERRFREDVQNRTVPGWPHLQFRGPFVDMSSHGSVLEAALPSSPERATACHPDRVARKPIIGAKLIKFANGGRGLRKHQPSR